LAIYSLSWAVFCGRLREELFAKTPNILGGWRKMEDLIGQ